MTTIKCSAPIAFRKTPISRRYPQPKKAQWKAKGIFHFFDLPAEIRRSILEILVDDARPHQVVNLLYASRQLYRETAELFYRDVTQITTNLPDKPSLYLAGRTTDLSQRLFVRNLTIEFKLQEHMHIFQSRYATTLRAMVDRGKLKQLILEIHGRFPSSQFWGMDSDASTEEVELVGTGTRKGQAPIIAPRFVAEPGFQSFLQFLREANVQEIRLLVDAYDHHGFWCRFHRQHPNGIACDGEWKGKGRRTLTVNWIQAVKALKGLQIVGSVVNETGGPSHGNISR
ncbi:hypothetical protein PFICI_00274 [Pestalotiopsis fici W106-1]|uniref:F-box domain-containing protein n=1 Tax=Pestalotiopsis fici (strain W106-1 / CGMCC3.15140) TaxID=1229662 RepID=W3XME5_PESFW|nr:uncharacterized protein PFICI_00274 [Pestalotiopsis fici W106-1]ETS86446.1 hypothetical protein PFICI_00274 [Pestalotiopsis fici W106-1]